MPAPVAVTVILIVLVVVSFVVILYLRFRDRIVIWSHQEIVPTLSTATVADLDLDLEDGTESLQSPITTATILSKKYPLKHHQQQLQQLQQQQQSSDPARQQQPRLTLTTTFPISHGTKSTTPTAIPTAAATTTTMIMPQGKSTLSPITIKGMASDLEDLGSPIKTRSSLSIETPSSRLSGAEAVREAYYQHHNLQKVS